MTTEEEDPAVKVEMEESEEGVAASILELSMDGELDQLGMRSQCLFCLKEKDALKTDAEERTMPLLPGAAGNNHINEELWTLFILRQMLKYPQKKIANLLKKSDGIQISRWFTLCQECIQTVREAMEVYIKLLKLAEEFKSFQKELTSTIQSSFLKENSQITGKSESYTLPEIRREIRDHFRKEKYTKTHSRLEGKGISSNIPHENQDPLMKCRNESCKESHGRPISITNDNLDNCQAPDEPDLSNPSINHDTVPMEYQEEDEGILDAGEDWQSGCDPVDEADPLYIPPSLVDAKSTGKKRPKRRPKRNGIRIVKKLMMNTQTGRRKSTQERRTYTFVEDDWPLVNASDEEEEEDPHKIRESFLKAFPPTKKAPPETPEVPETKLKEEEPETMHNCHVCGFKTEREKGLIWHMKRAHDITHQNEIDKCLEDGVYQCPKCPAKYPTRQKFARHKRLHQRNGAYLSFTCEICNYVAAAGNALRTHLKREHSMKAQYTCESCGKEFLHQPSLVRHKKKEHDSEEGNNLKSSESPENKKLGKGESKRKKKFVCKICLCRRLFSTAMGLRAHMRDHQTCKTPCPKCKYPCRDATALEVHLKRNLCNRMYEYECKSCNFKTERRYVFEAHKQMHLVEKSEKAVESEKDKQFASEDEKKFSCNMCSFTANKIGELNQHKSTHSIEEKKNSGKIFICVSCPYQTKCNADFENHTERHKVFDKSENIDGKLKCTLCGLLFDGQITFGKHMREMHASELGLRSFQCSMCDKHYAREYNLKVHVAQVHTKKCKFFCDICGFGAMKPSTLEIHMLSHSEEKSFVCDVCGSAVKTRDNLKKHMDTCHPDGASGLNTDRFKCKYCTHESRTFSTRVLRNEHIRSAHKDLYVHKCDQCGNTYCSVASLQLHKKTSHAGAAEQAECRFCHAKVASRFYLYSHYKYCHKYKFSKAK